MPKGVGRRIFTLLNNTSVARWENSFGKSKVVGRTTANISWSIGHPGDSEEICLLNEWNTLF